MTESFFSISISISMVNLPLNPTSIPFGFVPGTLAELPH